MAPDRLNRRRLVTSWLEAGLRAVDPDPLTHRALEGATGPATVVAMGKAAPAMCRGAAVALGSIDGLCVSDHEEEVPAGVHLVVGDHPVPGERSLAAGRLALEVAPHADLALISGGGSSLCEVPREGLDLDYLSMVHRRLVESGVPISELNHVRAALSQVKCGGLGPLPTYVLSDVAGSGPELVASGPTIPTHLDPEEVLGILERNHIPVAAPLPGLLAEAPARPVPPSISVIGDGRTAADGIAVAASATADTRVLPDWLGGHVEEAVETFVVGAATGVTVAAGEATMGRRGEGRGGRTTHAALVAAALIHGSDAVFAALATDGVDGTSGAAGAIVDGESLDRGGDPAAALARLDSAAYLHRSGDLIPGGPTGTNVADVWIIWRPGRASQPILTT